MHIIHSLCYIFDIHVSYFSHFLPHSAVYNSGQSCQAPTENCGNQRKKWRGVLFVVSPEKARKLRHWFCINNRPLTPRRIKKVSCNRMGYSVTSFRFRTTHQRPVTTHSCSRFLIPIFIFFLFGTVWHLPYDSLQQSSNPWRPPRETDKELWCRQTQVPRALFWKSHWIASSKRWKLLRRVHRY